MPAVSIQGCEEPGFALSIIHFQVGHERTLNWLAPRQAAESRAMFATEGPPSHPVPAVRPFADVTSRGKRGESASAGAHPALRRSSRRSLLLCVYSRWGQPPFRRLG